jgi:K+-dependent Na+/Ca+ exchanger-like protein
MLNTTTTSSTSSVGGEGVENASLVLCRVERLESTFPEDFFTLEQRQSGFIALHFFAAIYALVIAEHVCDEYFMPAFEYLSFVKLKLSAHVAGATLLAASSSFTELFASVVGVFFAKNDLSINALLGSGSYNLLVIVSICCFCVYKLNIRVYKYPVLRDSFFYLVSLGVLFTCLYKNNFNRLYWYDSLFSILVFVIYMLLNAFEVKLCKLLRAIVSALKCTCRCQLNQCCRCCCHKGRGDYEAAKQGDYEDCIEMDNRKKNPRNKTAAAAAAAATPIATNNNSEQIVVISKNKKQIIKVNETAKDRLEHYGDVDEDSDLDSDSIGDREYLEPYDFFKPYKHFKRHGFFKKLRLCFAFPARLLAYVTILDFRRFERCRDLALLVTFLSSVCIIGSCSYLLVWMVMIISETFSISDTIIGFTFLAAATSMEETITSISLCKREVKRATAKLDSFNRLNTALSNCIGSNIIDLSLCLGLPYLLNSLLISSNEHYTTIYNRNVSFTIVGLVLCLFAFLILIALFRFRLAKLFGILIFSLWLVYVTLVILIDFKLLKINLLNFGFFTC